MESYILIALASTVFFGANAIILKSAKNIDSTSLTLISLATAAFLTLLYWIFFVKEKILSSLGVASGVLSGAVYFLALLLFVVALKRGSTSVVATLNALSALVAVFLAVILLSEKLTLTKIAGIALGIAAAVLLAV
ncbi:MAG: EamA family transporter [archaeon]